MDEQSAQTNATEDQSQELQETTVEESTEATQDVTDESNASAVSQETAPEAPESETQEVIEPEEPDWVPEPVQAPKVDLPDIRKFVDAEGNLDLASYQQAQDQAFQAAMSATLNAATQSSQQLSKYEKEWNRAEDKFPELKKNKQLKDMVQAIHANSAMAGFTYLSPIKAAEQLFAFKGEAKSEGMKAAKESRTVQAAAGLGGSNPPAPSQSGNKTQQLKEKMRSGKTSSERKQATQDYLADLISTGRL